MSTERNPFVTDAELKQQASAYTQPYATEIYRNLTRLSQRYEAALASKDAEIEALRNPWISVKDRLPERQVYVTACHVHDGNQLVAPCFIRRDGLWETEFPVTHWMPLPTPPQP